MAKISVVETKPNLLWRVQNDWVMSGTLIVLLCLTVTCLFLICKRRKAVPHFSSKSSPSGNRKNI
jgi:hypothetical protein